MLFFLFAVSVLGSPEAEFTIFLNQFGKIYEGDEVAYRFGIFKETLNKIAIHNAGNHSWTEGINQFSDMTGQEFQRTMLGYLERKRSHPVEEVITPFADIDWVTKGAVTPIKDQKQCGSCWAFSTTGGMEGGHFVSTGDLISVSEQQLVDCSGSFGNQGCNGGLMDNAFKYAEKNALAKEDDYPYTARKGVCKHSVTGVYKVSTFTDVGKSESALASALQNQPVSIAVDATKWQSYRGGVFSGCASRVQLDHGVLAVGLSGTSSWKVKNSWGTSWGESGFIRLAYGSNECGLTNAASYPTC